MSACPLLSFNGVTAEAWTRLRLVGTKYGVAIAAHAGTLSVDGFTANWDYEAITERLTIQVTDSPWYMPCDAINGHINQAVGDAIKGP